MRGWEGSVGKCRLRSNSERKELSQWLEGRAELEGSMYSIGET